MKYWIVLLGLCLVGCNTREQVTVSDEVKLDTIEIPDGSLTKGEQDSLQEVLLPYLEVDTAYAKKANQAAQTVSEALGDDYGEEEYHRNIQHVDSVIKQCILYVQRNEPKRLLDLFDKERVNIYGHPSNTLGHEKDLHYMILSLYAKYYRPSHERLFAEKMAELYEMSFAHVMGLEAFGGYFHPDYLPLATVLIDCYSEGLGDYDRAIELQKQVCARVEQEEAEGKASESYGYELFGLADLYLGNGDTIRTDSCLLELRENPYLRMLFQSE